MQLVQKFPWAVKNGFDGSNRPQITLPHMHSIMGLPACRGWAAPASSRAQSRFSTRQKLLRKPANLVIRDSHLRPSTGCRPLRSRTSPGKKSPPPQTRSSFPRLSFTRRRNPVAISLFFVLLACTDIASDVHAPIILPCASNRGVVLTRKCPPKRGSCTSAVCSRPSRQV